MTTSLQFRPHLLPSPLPDVTRVPNHFVRPHQRRFGFGGGNGNGGDLISIRRNIFHGGGDRDKVGVVKFGFNFLDSGGDAADGIRQVFDGLEGVLYTIADSAVANSDKNGDWLSGITGYMEAVLKVLKDGLSGLNVPYSYGFAIILLTVLVKAATFPLTKKQVESAMAMRSLQPQVKAIQQRYAGNQEKIQLETARLYKLASINPLAGCLPTLATIPIWIGLYRALSNVADEGLLAEGFFWIPSLAGPTTIAARQSGSGISWLFPFIDGQPPLGWHDTLAYLVLPVLLIVTIRFGANHAVVTGISILMPPYCTSNDPNMKGSQAITQFLPLLIGYFSLSVPSGLSLYWLTNNILSTAQQVYLQKLDGAANPVNKLNDEIFKLEQQSVEKSSFEVAPVKEIPKQDEKPTVDGPRPGERFRLLKEQEARKKQEMEEQKRKNTEATTSGSAMTNGATSDFTDENNKSIDSETNGTIVNGNSNGQATDMTKVNGKAEQLSLEEQEKGND